MDYDIRPDKGVGPISFGMSPEKVRQALAVDVDAVDGKSDTGIPTDFFAGPGILVYYKQPGVCEAVEFAGPASPTFNGQHFLGRSYREMEQWVKTRDPEFVQNDAGLTSNQFGFGLYAPSSRKEPDLPVEGVIVFEKGYYED